MSVVCLPAMALAQRVSGDSKVRERHAPPPPVTRSTAPAGQRPAAAPTQETPKDPKERVVFKKRTIIDFTGALIEGDLIKPEGSYVVSRKASRFSSLIRVRENYLPELIASPNDL